MTRLACGLSAAYDQTDALSASSAAGQLRSSAPNKLVMETTPRFWRLQEPEYESEYQFGYINGSLDHPFGLPGVKCEVCGETWGGSRVLPFSCPDALRERPELREAWPIPGPEHRLLRSEVAEQLSQAGYDVETLLPGDDLQPGYLDVPSFPEADFLWASLGSVVVSNRVREIFSDLASDHVSFVPVVLRQVGETKASSIENTRVPGEYSEMIVHSTSALPRGVPTLSNCEGCGRPSYNNSDRILLMYPELWRGASVFLFATTLWVMITDDVRHALVNIRASNVAFHLAVPRDAV